MPSGSGRFSCETCRGSPSDRSPLTRPTVGYRRSDRHPGVGMKLLAGPLMLLAALIACRPSSQTAAERRAAAARADSSAAGYEVGVVATATPAPDTTSVPAPIPDSTRRAASTSTVATALPLGAIVPAPVTLGPRTGSSPRPRPVADTSRQRRGGGSPTSGSGLPPMDPALEATFLAFDSLKKSATFQLAAGTEVVDQVSINSVRQGGRVLTIPIGWYLRIEFTNHDGELPHSAMVVAAIEPIPEQLPSPAFPRAQTVKPDEGLLEGDSDEIGFLADRAGRYLIACGVLSHAQRGQWLVLEVSASATAPSYR